jgi:quinol monooxygenase YgiN
MQSSFGQLLAVVLVSLMLTAPAYAVSDESGHQPPGPVFDITHFDVIPLNQGGVDFQQVAYPALFKYRDASKSDKGSESFRIVNWLEASNHSHIVDVWSTLEAFEVHLAQPHSVNFRFSVQNQPPDGICCIGSPIDDRQYSLVKSFKTPWISNSLPSTVGSNGALFVITYVDFLEEGDPDKGQDKLVRYGAATSKANDQHLLNYTVLQQLDRSNRFAALEVWDTQANYTAWQGSAVTTNFVAEVTPLLGSPFDHRLNILCGRSFVDGTGCTPP